MLKILNLILAVGILICNIPLLIANFEIIRTHGGQMGVVLIASPFLLICNLFIIPSLLTFINKNYNKKSILILNILGIICCGFLAFILITTPKMD
ncbi:MAG TPA: hypothetical protein DEQ26_00390 [Flavobacteriaceae bacterium]|nr:hypothetical protein [Flavobacteriaceae bacterium]